ncbi:MAG: Sua5/YciO/YrdC/YwlC family protein, partial [Cardiobacteriaceae bacterium]|nr:Sua5/YciO/YrdC/YwlC family protein [Cardiobacteriaceae bacterium]
DALRAILERKKGRKAGQGVLVVAGSAALAQGYVAEITDKDWQEMVDAQTVRATTFLLPAGEKVARGAVVNGKVALRLTRHPLLAAVSNALGAPLFSTSANPHGLPPARSAEAVLQYFPDICLLGGALGGEEKPSRIVDWASGVVIRE